MRLMRASLEHIVARGEKIEPSFKGYEAVLEAVRVAGGQNLKENGDVTLKAIKSIGEPARTVNVKDFIGTADTKLLADAVILNMDKHGEWTKAYPREPITAVATNNKVETTIAAIKEAVSPTKVAAPDDLVSALNTQAKEILAKKGENSLLEGIGAYIKKLESSNKYNIRYNGRDEGSTFEGTEHPNIKVKIPGADGLTSTAAGAHQWLYTTWVDISKKMGTDVKDFSKEAQDKAFAFYVKELDKNGDLAKGNVSELFQKLTSTWPSLASGRSSIQKAASTISETSGVPLTDKVKEVFATVKDSTINGATAVGAGGSALLTGLKKAGSDLMGSIQPALDAYKKNGSISELASAIGEIIMKGIKSGLNSMSESFGIMKDTYTSLQSKNTPEDFARNLQSRFGRYFGPLAENVNATNLGNLGANAPQVYGTLDAMDKQTTILEQMRADGLKDSTAFKNATLALQQMGEQVASSMVRRQQEPPKVNRIAEIGNRISTTNMNNPDAVRAAIESANDALQGIATITDVAQLKKFAEGWDDVVGLLTNISELKKVKPGTFGFETSAKLRRESEDRVLANPALVGITNVRTPKYTPSEMAKSAGEKISGDVRGSMQQNLGDLLKGKTNIGDTIFAMNNTLQDSVKDILAGRLTKMFEESDANKTLKGWGEQLGGGKTPAEIEDQNRKHAWEVQVAAMPDGPEKDAATGVTQANRALDGGTYKGSGDTAGAYYDPITNAVMPLKEGAEAFKQWVDGMIAGTGKKGYDSVDPKTGKMIDAPTVSTDPATAADAIVTPLDSLNSTSSDGNSINMRGFKSVGKIMSGLSDISQMGFSNMIQTMLLQSAFGGGGGGSLMGNLIGGAVKAFSGGMDGAPAIQGMGGGAYAEGGAVVGAGTGTSDSIAALVSNGEFIVNAKSTRDNFSLLQAINNGRLPRFAVGGIVGSSIDSSTLAMPRSISQGNTSNSSTSVFNINVSGDVSRQTRSEIQRMIPQIASGVNMHNYEKGRR
jgi:muramidase (phage lysozyme)